VRALPGGEIIGDQFEANQHQGVISFFGKDFNSKDAVFWQETPKSIFKKKKIDLPKIEETKLEDNSDNVSKSKRKFFIFKHSLKFFSKERKE
jgi:hypothetical protein